MLPVRLRFSGLRSYRAGADIDFANLDLFAIIGDTGAGKSTIIEALCLALYARKSWSGGASISDLIADGEDVMRIEFEFVADDHPWRVTRARHRAILAAVQHNLVGALTGPTGQEELLAEQLRRAATELGRLTGRVDVEDILDVIFRDFCIGK